MHATTPPTENQLATREAILRVARAKLAPLYADPADLDALPAWLWSLSTQDIARSLDLDAPDFARTLAVKLDAETIRRHPAERFVAYLAEHHPLLSHVQRARLAEYAQAFKEVSRETFPVTERDMVRRGYTALECHKLTPRAVELIAATIDAGEPEPTAGDSDPADLLRAAGDLAHTRRAYAEGDLELRPATAARVAPIEHGSATA